MKVEKISRIIFTTNEHDFIATESHAEEECGLKHLGIDELVALRDYLQTMVEVRVYSKHIPKTSQGAGCLQHPGAFCSCGQMTGVEPIKFSIPARNDEESWKL